MKTIRLFILAFLFSGTAICQTWQDTLQLIDKTFAQYLPNIPGVQLSISRNNQLIFSKAWGMADLERNIPLSTSSILEAGSVSKQFTAAAILLLDQQHKLSIEDDIRKYIPELPNYGNPIKISYLLHHTSGIRDWGAVAGLTGWPRGKKYYTNEDALEIIARQKHLNNKPGAEYIYSNSNFNLLAILVERVSGLSLAAYTDKYIFKPAGLLHTSWRDNPNRIVMNRAIAYTKTDKDYEINMPNEYVYGNGGLLTTTEDLLQWNSYYQSGMLGNPSLLEKQIKTDPLGNGAMNTYAAGLFIQQVKGWNSISHSGATAGYRAFLESFPDLHLSYAVLSNNAGINIVTLARKIAALFLPPQPNHQTNPQGSIELSDPALQAFTGMYKNERDGSSFELTLKDHHLMEDKEIVLNAISSNSFSAGNFLLVMTKSGGFYIPLAPRDTIPFKKVTKARISSGDFQHYTGSYQSDETHSTLRILELNGKLMLQLKPNEFYELVPSYKNAFVVAALEADIECVLPSGNKFQALIINMPRARNLVFKRVGFNLK